MAGMLSALGNKPESYKQFSRFNPEVQQGINPLIQKGLKQQQNTTFDFAPYEQKIRQDYNSKTVPTLVNRFLAGDTQDSSGFRNALEESGKNLDFGLAQLRNSHNQQGFDNLLRLIQGTEPNSFYSQEEPGALEGALPGLLKALTQYAGQRGQYNTENGNDQGGGYDGQYHSELANTAADWAPGAGGAIGTGIGGPVGGAVGTGIGALLQLIAKYFNKKGANTVTQSTNQMNPQTQYTDMYIAQ